MSNSLDISNINGLEQQKRLFYYNQVIAVITDFETNANYVNEDIELLYFRLVNEGVISSVLTTVTKASIGLGNVNNTADMSKPVSTAMGLALAAKADSNNPTFTGAVTGITKSHVGLGNVDNTSDVNKPISYETQLALNAKASTDHQHAAGSAFSSGVINPIYLGSGTKDASTILYGDGQFRPVTEVVSGVSSVNGETGAVTIAKSDLGLSNVDNTTDLNKPVSTATQNALNLKANENAVVKSVNNVTPINGNVTIGTSGGTIIATDISDSTAIGRGVLTASSGLNARNVIGAGTSNVTIGTTAGTAKEGNYVPTKAEVGLSNVNNTSDLAKPISNDTQAALNLKSNTGHTHTKNEVGLDSVDNTSDLNKPISTAVQAALDTKGTSNLVIGTTATTAKAGNYAPTKADVGLSNVDNTSDLNKPISTATTIALAAKQGTDPFLDQISALTDPNADRMLFWDDSIGSMAFLTPSTGLTVSGTNMTVRSASETQTGIVEMATNAETLAGTDTTRATTPAGVVAAIDAAIVSTISNSYQINAKQDGAVGDGVTDDLAALKTTIEGAPAGSTIYFPPGRYFHATGNAADETGFIIVDQDNISFSASPGSVVLENIQIYLKGTYGASYVSVGASGVQEGANTVVTATAHGLVAGDYFQLLGEKNIYTTDAGDWQLGSPNPTNGTTPTARFSEVHRVVKVISTTEVEIDDLVIYPDYKNNVTGLAFPMAGVTTSQIRKLNPLKNVNFYGITFENYTSSFRGIVGRACVDPTFDQCKWISSDVPGAHFKFTDTLGLLVIKSKSIRHAMVATSGSSWNSFLVGGGSSRAVFEDCDFVGEAQCIDITPNLMGGAGTADPGYSALTEYASAQYLRVSNCRFTNCSDSITSHPGTYLFEATNNLIMGGSTGIRGRSRACKIRGNTIYTARAGISISAFCSDSMVSENDCIQINSLVTKLSTFYTGIDYNGIGSETDNNNNVQSVVITRNRIKVSKENATNRGIILAHNAPGGYTFTDATKMNLSDITVSYNTLDGCSLLVTAWIHGTKIYRNVFTGVSDNPIWIDCYTNSGRNVIYKNVFETPAPSFDIRTGSIVAPASISYGYNTVNRVGEQYSYYNPATFSLQNNTTMFTTSPA